jgi:RNA polymerase sigma factor (sigma-70 family)
VSSEHPDQQTDLTLLRRYHLDRDMCSFHQVIQRHQGDLLRLAHALVGEASLAEDVVQEAFLRLVRETANLLEKAQQASGREGIGGWLCTVVRNQCLDLLRKRRVVRFFSLEEDGRCDAAPPAAADGALVWRNVSSLPPLERAAVMLRYRDGLEYRDIAAQLGKSVTHVGQILHQALGRLRQSAALKIEAS